MNRKLVFVAIIVAIALITSLGFNVYYYVNVRREHENLLHTMRARALWTYGAEIGMVAIYLEEYLDTLDFDMIDQDVCWAIYRAMVQADLLKEGLTKDSGLLYYELGRTARILENYFVFKYYGPINTTTIQMFIPALDAIGSALTQDLDLIENKDPLDVIASYARSGIGPSIDDIMNYCLQIQETVQ